MQPYQERVVQERDELVARLERLQAFIASDAFGEIHAPEAIRLVNQSIAMRVYAEILCERIEAFTNPPTVGS